VHRGCARSLPSAPTIYVQAHHAARMSYT
jgi:hypothetical protein